MQTHNNLQQYNANAIKKDLPLKYKAKSLGDYFKVSQSIVLQKVFRNIYVFILETKPSNLQTIQQYLLRTLDGLLDDT